MACSLEICAWEAAGFHFQASLENWASNALVFLNECQTALVEGGEVPFGPRELDSSLELSDNTVQLLRVKQIPKQGPLVTECHFHALYVIYESNHVHHLTTCDRITHEGCYYQVWMGLMVSLITSNSFSLQNFTECVYAWIPASHSKSQGQASQWWIWQGQTRGHLLHTQRLDLLK